MAGAVCDSGLTCVTVTALERTMLRYPLTRTLLLIILFVLGNGCGGFECLLCAELIFITADLLSSCNFFGERLLCYVFHCSSPF